jgi:ATP-dependent DNA helicase UvrD/PcrA
LVVAGAGAGKTETMAARVVWLVANGLVQPDQVLGLTFTRKAARQLAERIRARLRRLGGSPLLDELDPSGQRRMAVLTGEPTVLTYHAYAGRLVGEHGLRLPVQPGARLLTETSSWQLANQVVTTWADDLDTDKVPATVTEHVLRLAGELAEHLVDPDDIRAVTERVTRWIMEAPPHKGRAGKVSDLKKIVAAQQFRVSLLPLVEAYEAAKRREGALDFGDQMALAARLAADHDEVVAAERERYATVLLDEYQDTGHSQRVLLRSLFGGGAGIPVTAVGDPAQAIYGWRGASAANLPRFTTDFPVRVGRVLRPAREYGLLTSFRNPPEVLALANEVAEPLRASGLAVDRLRPREDAPEGDVRVALLEDIRTERDWVADQIAARWREGELTGELPTAAVLVRRRADMPEIAAALRARDLPVEVVGLGGLLDEPEIRDLVSALRVLVDPLAGTAAARLLTGSRWRLGAADLSAVWQRARVLAGESPTGTGGSDPLAAVLDALPGEHAEQACLVDALDDPGDPAQYTQQGHARLTRLGGELAALRRRLDQPLPELVADVERTLLLDIETLSRPGAGRANLDAFADVVGDYAAATPSATLTALLGYLAAAEVAEDGLEKAEVVVAPDRVQVLTVHAAKGLEWQVVAVPHLVKDVFPSRKRASSWLKNVTELPAALRGDRDDLPRLVLDDEADRKAVTEALEAHEQEFDHRRVVEERRLLYVALTRAERTLVISGHWWNETSATPREPSPFLVQIGEVLSATDSWAVRPAADQPNPLTEVTVTAQWPADPLGERRGPVAEGAALVLAAMDDLPAPDAPADQLTMDFDDPEGWARDVDVLLAERAAARARRERVVLPDHLSVSQLVELAVDREALARRLRRPLPYPPNPVARRGTAFHAWLERRFSCGRLLDLDDLPGAADDTAPTDEDFEVLREAFLASEWAERTPHDVEVPFATEVDGISVRGRMDAVFADPDGGWTVVDWKTGAVPSAERLPSLAVQLGAYRLAWASLSGAPLAKVRAAFHYVRHDRTIRPADLLDLDGLRALLRSIPAS